MHYTLQYNFLSCRKDDEQYEITDLFHVFTKLRKAYTYTPNKKDMAESKPMCTQKRFFVDQKYVDFFKVYPALFNRQKSGKKSCFFRKGESEACFFVYLLASRYNTFLLWVTPDNRDSG